MQVRDLKKDLEVCELATPGPWIVMPEVCGPDGQSVYHEETLGPICDVGDPYPRGDNRPTENMRFIAAARTGWPDAIKRAMTVEYELSRRAPISNAEYETLIEHGRRERGEMAALQAEVERMRAVLRLIDEATQDETSYAGSIANQALIREEVTSNER